MLNAASCWQEHLELGEEADHVDLDHFLEKVWPNIRDFYKSPFDKDIKGDSDDAADQKVSHHY